MSAARRRARWALVAGLLAGIMPGLGAGPARAAGLWSTYLRMNTVQDVLALRDTVWLATRDAGLVRWQRSTGAWSSITREPGGLAGNDVRAIAFDRTGNLFAAVPGKGLSRLDLDGKWSLINAFDGLPSDTVLALQAYGDTIWIGTTRGLAFWDGETVAGSIPDLGTTSPFSNNNINGIAILGDTLVASNPEGISIARLSQRLQTWTLVSGTIPLNNKVVHGIASDGRDLLALVSGSNISGGGSIFTSFRWSPGTNSWPVETPPASAAVRRLRDDHGVIVATTTAGTHIRNGLNAWTDVAGLPATNNDDSRQVEPGADPDRNVFAAMAGQLFTTGQPAQTPPGPIANTCRNVAWSDGSVYVAYEGAGISRLRDGVWRNYPPRACVGAECDTTFALPVFPAGMLVDPRGTRWIANWAGPLSRFDDRVEPPLFDNISFQTSNPDTAHLHTCIHSMAADSTTGAQAGIWCGLDSDRIGQENGNPLGLDLYDQNGNFIRNFGTTYPGLRNGLIRGLACDRTNTMWVGYKGSSGAGLSTFAVRDNLPLDIELTDVAGTNLMDVFGIDIRGDSVWVLATDKLYRYRVGAKTRAAELAIAGPPALAGMHPLAVAPNGTVFVGTTGGLRVHRRGFPPVDYTPDNSPLADLEVRAVYCEPSGAVWIATARGLNRFDPEYLPPPEPTLPSLHVRLWPNPAWLTGAGFQLRLAGEALAYAGEVHDLTGRVVHRFSVGGNGAVVWDGRGREGRPVEPGIYFVRVRGGGAEATSRVVVLR
jgi:hypothetical protein